MEDVQKKLEEIYEIAKEKKDTGMMLSVVYALQESIKTK